MSSPSSAPASFSHTQTKISKSVFAVILAFALICGVAQWAIRIDFGPDEPYHLEYVHILATQGRLPTKSETHEAQHPPSYFLLLAMPWKIMNIEQRPLSITPGANALKQIAPQAVMARRVLRGVTTLLGCVMLLVMARMLASLSVPGAWQAFFIGVIAASPMLQYICSVVNNEIASVLYSTLLCTWVVHAVLSKPPLPRLAVFSGILVAGCLLIKQNTLFAAPILAWCVVASTKNNKAVTKEIFVFIATALLCASPWLIFNWMRLGHLLPRILQPEDQPALADYIAQPQILVGWLRTLMESAVLPDWSWDFLPRTLSTAVALVMLIVFVILAVKKNSDVKDILGRRLNAMSVASAILLLIGVMEFAMFDDWRGHVGGRYLLNCLPWAAVLVAVWLPPVRQKLIARQNFNTDVESIVPEPALSTTDGQSKSDVAISTGWSSPPLWAWAVLGSVWCLDLVWWSLVNVYYTAHYPL